MRVLRRLRRVGFGALAAVLLAGCATTSVTETDDLAEPEELSVWQETANVVTWPFRMAGALVYYPVRFVVWDVWAGLYDAAGDDALVTAFREADDAGRPAAARAAAAAGHRAIVPGLLTMLESMDGAQRAAAVDALEMLGAQDLGPELLRRLGAERRAGPAIAIAEAIGAVGAHDTWPALADAARSHPALPQRVASIHALGKLHARNARWALIAALQHDAAPVRQQAAWALGEVGDRRAAPFLLPRLSDASPEVRAAVVMAIGRLGDDTAGPTITAMLARHHRPETPEEALLAIAAAVACGRLQLTESVPSLRAMLAPLPRDFDEQDPPWEAPLTASAAQALGRLGDTDARVLLRPLLAHRDARVSRTAGLALGALGGTEELARGLRHDQARAREAAAVGLGRLGGDRAAALLWDVAGVDHDGTVRHAAARALLALGDRRGLDLLVSELTRGGIQARAASLDVLERLSNEQFGLDAGAWQAWRKAHGDAIDLTPFRYGGRAG
jgi:HEAT repeat protein